MAASGKVLIIGGGLSGLALAQCLRRQNISFEIFDSDPSPHSRTQSWTILLRECLAGLKHLLPNDMPPLEESVSTLQGLSPEDLAVASDNGNHTATNFCALHYSTGEIIDRYFSSDASDLIHCFVRANRAKFRTWLQHNINIQWNKRFVRYEELDSGVRAHFEDGTTSEGTVLVAADGSRSRVRSELLGAEKCKLQAAPLEAISANINLSHDEYRELLSKGATAIMSNCPSFHFFIGPQAFSEGIGEYYWIVCAEKKDIPSSDSTNASTNEKQSGETALNKALEITRDLHPSLRRYVERTQSHETLSTSSALMQWSPPDVLPGRRIFLIGDSLHAMAPFRGGGANTALLDAYDLAQLFDQAVTKGKDFCETKTSYEKIAVPRGQGMVQFSRSAGTSPDPTFWAKMVRGLTDNGFEWKKLDQVL